MRRGEKQRLLPYLLLTVQVGSKFFNIRLVTAMSKFHPFITQIGLHEGGTIEGPTVFRGPRNFEPSSGIYIILVDFDIFTLKPHFLCRKLLTKVPNKQQGTLEKLIHQYLALVSYCSRHDSISAVSCYRPIHSHGTI